MHAALAVSDEDVLLKTATSRLDIRSENAYKTGMLVAVGTKNRPKIEAVQLVLLLYPDLFTSRQSKPEALRLFGFNVDSGVSSQPKSLEETIQGAQHRAVRSFRALDSEQGARCCDLSFGIESGELPVPSFGGPPLQVTACVAYDGTRETLGLSGGFQIPESVYRHMRGGKNLSEAARLAGLTDDHDIGASQGIAKLLTRGRVSRMDNTALAVHFALIDLH